MNPDPNWLQDQLKAGESVTALFHARDGTVWYATTGRVIKYKRDRFETRTLEVPLDDIRDIQFQKRTNVRVMGYGALLVFLGFFFFFLSFFTGLYPFAFLSLLVGGGLLAYGYIKDTYLYQFYGDELDEEEWQIPDTGKTARFFVKSIRQLKGLEE